MNFRNLLFRFILSSTFLFPILAMAGHNISITNTSPFPLPAVATSTTSTSVFTVKNTTTKTTLTVVDQSQFPDGSGLTILSNTCGQPLPPQQSCVITLQLIAPATPQTISTSLKEAAQPSADAVQFPITIPVIILSNIPYTVTPTAGTGGTISPNTPQIVFGGNNVTFTATPASQNVVNQWLVDGVVAQTGGTTFTLNNVTANHTVQVTFFLPLTVTPSAGTGGTIIPNTPQTVTYGTNITFTATPNAQTLINQWLVDGVVAQTGGTSFTLNNVTANHTVQVTFFLPLTVTSSAGTGGTISPTGPQTVTHGTNITFTATPNAQTLINQWLVDSVVAQTGGTTFTLTNVTANHTVQVTFTPPLTVTPSASAGGSISPSTPQTVTSGTDITFTATPNAFFVVLNWLVDSVVVQTGGTSFTLTNVTANHAVQVVFIQTYAITPSVSGGGGSISPSTLQTVNQGTNLTFTATPNTLMGAYQWKVDTVLTQTFGNTFTLTNIIADHTVSISFQATISEIMAGNSTSSSPFIGLSTDGGFTFAAPTSVTAPSSAQYNSAICIGPSLSAICSLVGRDLTGIANPPLINISNDGGNTWTTPTITGLPTSGQFLSTSCTGSGITAVCTASGTDNTLSTNAPPLFAVSQDGGQTWAVNAFVDSLSVNGNMNATSCTGSGATAFCIAAGDDQSGGSSLIPLLAQSVDGGTTWTQVTSTTTPPPGPLTFGRLFGASCTGGNLCVAVGNDSSTGAPLFLASSDTGTSWAQSEDSTTSITMKAASCTGTGASTVCAAVGTNTTPDVPTVYVSTDLGVTWVAHPIHGITATNTTITSISCIGSGVTAICAAGGFDNTIPASTIGLVIVSIDGGSTWTQVTLPGIGSHSAISTTHCTSNATFNLCTAGGDTANNHTYVATSQDGGNTWVQNTSPIFPLGGFATAAGAPTS